MINENNYFEIKEFIEMGRGLYAKRDLPEGCVIHTSELVILSKEDTKKCEKHNILQDYLYPYTRFQDAMMLGYGVLFNGDPELANVKDEVIFCDRRPMVKFTTTRAILAGEQLFLDYKYYPEESNEKDA